MPDSPTSSPAPGQPTAPGAGPSASEPWSGRALPVPDTEAGREGLAALLADPQGALIGVDFDGTLAPIVPEPADARALPAAAAAVRRLSELVGTVAIITGRPARDAAEFAGLADVAALIILGLYGRQRWSAGTLTALPPPPGLADARRQLPGVLTGADAPAGTWIEDKGDALAVHTRRTAEPGRALEQLRPPLADLADRAGLAVEPGRMVIELRPPGAGKGQALTHLVAERHARAVLYCGDDLGDRPAFAAVRELRAQGIPGLAVCSGSAEVIELAREADLVVDGPAGVAGLLEALADALEAPR